eukprot:6728748-Alexandrium_andersonii.AAC.1
MCGASISLLLVGSSVYSQASSSQCHSQLCNHRLAPLRRPPSPPKRFREPRRVPEGSGELKGALESSGELQRLPDSSGEFGRADGNTGQLSPPRDPAGGPHLSVSSAGETEFSKHGQQDLGM